MAKAKRAARPTWTMAPRTREIALNSAYRGVVIDVIANPTLGAIRALAAVKEADEASIDVVARFIVGWNVVDEHGNPIPPPAEGGFDQVDARLIRPVVDAFIEAIFKEVTDPDAVPKVSS